MIELIYCLFLLSGLVKSFLLFYAPGLAVVDFTLLCAVILLAMYVFQWGKNFFFRSRLYIRKSIRPLVFVLSVFFLWMIVSLIYTASPSYGYIKVFMFLSLIMAILIPFSYKGFSPERFFHLSAYFGTGLIFLYSALLPNVYANYLRYEESREFVVKYLDVGFLAGLMILILAFASPRVKLLPKILLIGINAWTILISSARGPMVFLFFVLMIRFLVSTVTFMRRSWTFSFKNILYVLGGIGIFATAVSYFMDRYALLLERSITRLLMLTDLESGSVSERFSQLIFSFEKIFHKAVNFLFGLGIGSFGILYEGVDERNYPHNVVLEIWFELGVVGLILFLFMLYLYFKRIRFHLNFLLIFIYLLLNSLKSYSLIDLRIMFGIISVLAIHPLVSFILKENKEMGTGNSKLKSTGMQKKKAGITEDRQLQS